MSGEPRRPGLASLQRWLQAASTHPGGLDAGIREAQRELQVEADQLDAVIDSTFGIDARRRVGIYHHGYFARLLECMRAEYPVLAGALSRDWFDKMALRYIAHRPSTSWTLAELGAAFPDFLESDRPDAAGGERERAFDLVVELARLERGLAEISRGPGIEGTDLSVFDGLEERDPSGLRLVLSPSLRLQRASFDLVEYVEATRRGRRVGLPEDRPQCIVLCRLDFRARAHEVEEWQYDLLARLAEDGRLAPALAGVAAAHPGEPVDARWPVWLALSAERGFFAGQADRAGRSAP